MVIGQGRVPHCLLQLPQAVRTVDPRKICVKEATPYEKDKGKRIEKDLFIRYSFILMNSRFFQCVVQTDGEDRKTRSHTNGEKKDIEDGGSEGGKQEVSVVGERSEEGKDKAHNGTGGPIFRRGSGGSLFKKKGHDNASDREKAHRMEGEHFLSAVKAQQSKNNSY